MKEEILKIIRTRGLLLDKSIFDVLDGLEDIDLAKELIENLEKVSGSKMITKTSLNKNYEYVKSVVRELPGEMKNYVENVFIKLGISFEYKKESEIINKAEETEEKTTELEKAKNYLERNNNQNYKVFYSIHDNNKKIGVNDFVGHFRARYQQLQRILMQRTGLDNLISINKISGNRQNFTFIGIVAEKRITKNKNLIVKFEDLTGELNVLIKADKDCYKDAYELLLDDVVAVKCSGNKEMAFAHAVIYPDSMIFEKTRFNEEVCVSFISDIHVGSKKHLGKEFSRFIEWLGSDDELAKKIRYLFVVGDSVDGVGVFPGQERLLELKSLKEQYRAYAEYLKKIPERITIFQCHGQHDSVRVPEPQPIIDNFYGEALYKIPNLVLVSNPSMIKLLEKENEFKILMYHGASIHGFINEIDELRLMKAQKTPAKAVRHMLKRRHLAPTHSSVVYVPNTERDPLVIDEVPDILCTGEVHRLDIEKYNGVLILTGSCWQARTDFEEKVGNIPDPCKVPIFNLKTHEIKVLDFSGEAG